MSIFSCTSPPDAASLPSTERRCEAISRPTRSAFVRIDATGATTRWPVLRPACARAGHHADAFVIVDDSGALISVAGQEARLPAASVVDGACLERVRTVADGFVVVGDHAAERFTAAGRAPQRLPPGIPTRKVHGFYASSFLLRDPDEGVRFVDRNGTAFRPLFVRPAARDAKPSVASLDEEDGVGVDLDVISAYRDGDVSVWEKRAETSRGSHRRVVRVPGRSVVVDVPVVVLRNRALVLRGDRVDELRADGADRVRVALRPDVDAAGTALDDRVRERASFVVDGDSGAVLVAERLRAPDCSIDDRLTIIDDNGHVRALGLPPAMRTAPRLVDGVVFFVESDVVYEAFNDESGTSLP